MLLLLSICVYVQLVKSLDLDPIYNGRLPPNPYPIIHQQPQPIENEIYNNLFTYAHLTDIAYCVSSRGRIEEPFECDLNCHSRFPDVSLVYQWYFDDSVCGYIATTYSNMFNYSETTNKKTVIVSLRGTHSLLDSYTDIKVDMVNYKSVGINLPPCKDCRIHRGFNTYAIATLERIDAIVQHELNTRDSEDYELLILGHSLGGAISLLLGLHYADMGYDKMTLVTMGQPLVGNEAFVNWADDVLGSHKDIVHNSFQRKYFRVVHKNDVVTTIPSNGDIRDSYCQFDNQIYLNCSSSETMPLNDQVVDCFGKNNQLCIKGDFDDDPGISFGQPSRNYLQIHTHYFRSMGLCGMGIRM